MRRTSARLDVGIALVANRVARRAVRRLTDRVGRVTARHGESVVNERNVVQAEARAATIGSLLRSLAAASIFGAAGIMILEVLGISIIPVIASAGVLSLAIGFGAQSVVEDLARRLFMVAEDQFGVGDRIDVGHVNGYVERITLRTVVVRDPDGTLWHVPNSEIDRVANENQDHSRAAVLIGVTIRPTKPTSTAQVDQHGRPDRRRRDRPTAGPALTTWRGGHLVNRPRRVNPREGVQ